MRRRLPDPIPFSENGDDDKVIDLRTLCRAIDSHDGISLARLPSCFVHAIAWRDSSCTFYSGLAQLDERNRTENPKMQPFVKDPRSSCDTMNSGIKEESNIRVQQSVAILAGAVYARATLLYLMEASFFWGEVSATRHAVNCERRFFPDYETWRSSFSRKVWRKNIPRA